MANSLGPSLGGAGWATLVKPQLAVRASRGRGVLRLSSESVIPKSQRPQSRWEGKGVTGLL